MTNIDTDKFVITDFRSITFEQFDDFVKKEECDTWVLDLQTFEDNKQYYEYGCKNLQHIVLLDKKTKDIVAFWLFYLTIQDSTKEIIAERSTIINKKYRGQGLGAKINSLGHRYIVANWDIRKIYGRVKKSNKKWISSLKKNLGNYELDGDTGIEEPDITFIGRHLDFQFPPDMFNKNLDILEGEIK
tara:strand:- start:41 stop:601 length:561 start_codon:yes stop_codon:yes gene_type:complete